MGTWILKMKTAILPFAQRGAETEINQWLNENPLVLGAIFLVIGGVLACAGLYGLWKGVAWDKYGNEFRGGKGQFIAVVQLVGGLVACGFAVYKMVGG